MKKYLKASLFFVFVFSFVLAPYLVKAQTEGSNTLECTDLQNNLKFSDRDVNKNGEVTILQKYLKSQGYLSIAPSGYFGTSTLKAVINFQKANNIKPALGFVGSLTKSKIKDLSCVETLNENCFNGIQDWGETGIDQGGDCTTLVASCFDGILNGDETGIDAGGSCVKTCPEGMAGTYPNCIIVFAPKPTVNLSLSPASVSYGGSTTLTWSSTNATSCSASGGWTGAKNLSGSEVIYNLTAPNIFVLTCENAQNSAFASRSIQVASPAIPIVTFSVNSLVIDYGGSTTLTWTTKNAKTCTASDAWSGNKPLSGSEVISNITNQTKFTLTCIGESVDISTGISRLIEVRKQLSPNVVINSSPASVESGQSTTLTWNSVNATTCTASGDWSGNKPLSGSEVIYNLTTTKTFTLTCVGAGGSATNSTQVGVYVVDPVFCPEGTTGTYPNCIKTVCPTGTTGIYPNCVFVPPTASLEFNANSTNLYFGGQTNLSWKATGVSLCEASGAWTGSKNTEANLTINIDFLGTKTYTLTCKNQGGPLLVEKSVTINATQNPSYLPGCASNSGYSITTGQSCISTVVNPTVISTASSDLTPRVSIWGTKLSQYLNDKGFWVTDLNSGYVHTNEILRFCKKWYPTTTSLEYYKEEYIPNWVNLSTGANETFYSNHFSYKCVGGTHSGPSKVLGAEIDVENSCSLSKILMKGMNSEEVKCLQKKLNKKGYQVKGTEQGKEITFFGYNTELALKKFQIENGLKPDGILGLKSRELINN